MTQKIMDAEQQPDADRQQYVEPSLLGRLQQGDQAAFASLVREHHRALLAMATPLVGSSNAEEVVQNTWVKAYQAIAGFQGRSTLRTWLSRIVINEGRMWLRKHKREVLLDDLGGAGEQGDSPMLDRFKPAGGWSHPPAHWHTDSPDGLLMEEQLADCLQKILAAMPANQRAMLEMRDVGELDFSEICNLLDISASNARVLLHRARTRLFGLVDHYQETGEC